MKVLVSVKRVVDFNVIFYSMALLSEGEPRRKTMTRVQDASAARAGERLRRSHGYHPRCNRLLARRPDPVGKHVKPLPRVRHRYLISGTNLVFVAAPKGTPAAVVAKLTIALNDVMAAPAFRARTKAIGVEVERQATRTLVQSAINKWHPIITTTGAQAQTSR